MIKNRLNRRWKQKKCKHDYEQFNKLVYIDGLPIYKYGKRCEKCGKEKRL